MATPTYVTANVNANHQRCSLCGAVVVDPAVHTAWHQGGVV